MKMYEKINRKFILQMLKPKTMEQKKDSAILSETIYCGNCGYKICQIKIIVLIVERNWDIL